MRSRANFTAALKLQLCQSTFLLSWKSVELTTKPHFETEYCTKHFNYSQILNMWVHFCKFKYKNPCALCTETEQWLDFRIKMWLCMQNTKKLYTIHIPKRNASPLPKQNWTKARALGCMVWWLSQVNVAAKELKLFRTFLRLITISKILLCFPVTTSTQKENKKAKEDLQCWFWILHLYHFCKCVPSGTNAINVIGRPAPRK